jgi:hypothetical protein
MLRRSAGGNPPPGQTYHALCNLHEVTARCITAGMLQQLSGRDPQVCTMRCTQQYQPPLNCCSCRCCSFAGTQSAIAAYWVDTPNQTPAVACLHMKCKCRGGTQQTLTVADAKTHLAPNICICNHGAPATNGHTRAVLSAVLLAPASKETGRNRPSCCCIAAVCARQTRGAGWTSPAAVGSCEQLAAGRCSFCRAYPAPSDGGDLWGRTTPAGPKEATQHCLLLLPLHDAALLMRVHYSAPVVARQGAARCQAAGYIIPGGRCRGSDRDMPPRPACNCSKLPPPAAPPLLLLAPMPPGCCCCCCSCVAACEPGGALSGMPVGPGLLLLARGPPACCCCCACCCCIPAYGPKPAP